MLNSLRPIRYTFGPFVLLATERRLTRGQQALAIGPRAFDILLVLLQHAGELVEKRVLLENVWPGLVVEDNTLQAVISTLRKLLGSDSISTVSKFGYRLNFACTSEEPSASNAAQTQARHFPAIQSSFIGRDSELQALSRLLTRSRNVSIVGPGGAGKTRLAVETARLLEHRFADGSWFLDLTGLREGSMLIDRVAAMLEITETSNAAKTAAVIEHLAPRSTLLIIDNAEHLAGEVTVLIDELLAGCARLVILTTSRQSSASIAELVFRIPALSLPEHGSSSPAELLACDSVRLFIERARLHRAHFEPDESAARSIGRICQRLDGMPLSIELAASRIRSMAVAEIDQRLDEALRLLIAPATGTARRHQTLRALIGWSYDLLSLEEQQAFRRFSVFFGGFTLDMAEALFAAAGIPSWTTLDLLEKLVDKSMLSVDASGAERRYRHLETMRQYAEERLGDSGESDEWQLLHLKYFADRIQKATAGTDYLSSAMHFMETESANLDAALRAALEVDSLAVQGLQMSVDLTRYWYGQGNHFAARFWLTRLLDKAPGAGHDLLRIKALSWIGAFTNAMKEYAAADKAHQASIDLARDCRNGLGLLLALNNFSGSLDFQGQYLKAVALMLDAIDLLGLASKHRNSEALTSLERYSNREGMARLPRSEIEDLSQDLAATLDATQIYSRLSLYLRNLGMRLRRVDDLEGAKVALLEAASVAERTGDPVMLAMCWTTLGDVTEALGDLHETRRLYAAAFQRLAGSGDKRLIYGALQGLARSMTHLGDALQAARFWGAAERLREESKAVLTAQEQLDHPSIVAATVLALGSETRYQELFQGGHHASLPELLAELETVVVSA